jgi:CRISPR/Cas system-associated exonuclease Cas4 (RecB family)
MIDQINLKEKTLQWFARKQFRSKSKGTLWPSEASAEYINQYGEKEVAGKCHRAVYYRVSGVSPTNPPDAKSQVVFLLGNSIEDTVTEAWKQMGIWENNSVKWEDKARNLSGEYDVILREGADFYGVEVKSFYGYVANKTILGHSEGRGPKKIWIPGKPKDEHLMQAALYVAHSEGQLKGFKLFYVSRDNCDMAEFNITLDQNKDIFINGRKEIRFNLENIYERYQRLNTAIDSEVKPPREFTFLLSDERVEELFKRGDLAKSVYEAHKTKKQNARDWHCSYCDFRDHCWKVDKDDLGQIAIPEDVETVEIEEVHEMHMHGSL